MNANHFLFAHAAQQPPTGTTADDRGQAFRPVEGGNELQSGEMLLVEAYAAIWVIIFALIFFSWRRQTRMNERIDALAAAVQKARAGSGQGSG